ncbi:MAG: heavy-metal-associated domain-containing protein [Fimbriimonadia bacterium]|jgi:copper chaperone CopZ
MTLELKCPDIECDGCAGSIRRALEGHAGLTSVQVDVASKTVRLDGEEAAVESAKAKLSEIGFPPAE